MARFRIKKGSIDRLRERIPKVKKQKEQALVFGLTHWADDAVTEVQSEIQKVGAIDQGMLLGATARSQPLLSGSRLKIAVFNPLEYAPVVEFGRRPKKGKPPPLQPLIGWAKRRGMLRSLPANPNLSALKEELIASSAILKRMGRGRGGRGRRKPLDPIVRDLLTVRLIARKIFERGTRARHPFTIAFFRKKQTITRDVARTVNFLS